MIDKDLSANERGVSEVFGALLIFSIAFLVAASLVGFGYILVQDSSNSSNDRVAEDSMVELSERLDGLTADSLSGSTGWSPPEGAADNFAAQSDRGVINISVATNETYWDTTTNPGDLVDATSRVNYENITVGTIRHEAEDRDITAYQGGGLFRKSGDAVEVLREPGIDVVDNRLQLSLIDVSSVEFVGDDELVLNQETNTIGTQDVQQMVNEAMQRNGQITAPATINATVTSEYAAGWATYARTIDDVEAVIEGENHPELSDNQVRIVFGEFGDGIHPVNPNFDNDILYTGLSDYAPDLYEQTEGQINDSDTGKGFNVTDPASSDYMVGMLYQTGGSYEWHAWSPDGYGNNWVNVEEPNPRDRVLGGSTAPDVVDGLDTADGEFRIRNGTWVTAINTSGSPQTLETFRSYLPNESDYDPTVNSNGILTDPVDISDPSEQTGDYGPYLDIQTFHAEVINSTTNSPATTSVPYEVGEYYVELGITGENNGSADAYNEPAALLWDKQSTPDSPGFVNASYNDPDIGDSFKLNGSFVPTDSAFYEFDAGTGQNKSTTTAVIEFSEPNLDGNFEVDITNVDDEDANGDTVIEENGDPVEVTVEIENTDTSSAEVQQPIRFEFDDERRIGGLTVTLDGGDSTTGNFSWVPKDGDADLADVSDLNVSSQDDYDTQSVDIRDDDDVASNFAISDINTSDSVEVGDRLEVEFDVENTGELRDTQGVLLRNASTGRVLDGTNVELDSGESTSVQLNWTATTAAAGSNYEFRLTTNDNSRNFSVDVDSLERNSTFDVEIVDTDPADSVAIGQRLEVNVSVTNTGDSDTKAVWLEDFDGNQTDVTDVTLDRAQTKYTTLTWDPRPENLDGANSRNDTFAAKSPDTEDSEFIEVIDPETEPNFDVNITSAESPVTEGESLNVTVEVTNSGAAGETRLVLQNIDGDAVDIASTGTIATGDSVTRELTWFTLVGDAGTNPPAEGNITVTGENTSAMAPVTIEQKQRPPVNLAFALDETGSMGAYVSYYDWMEVENTNTLSTETTVPAGDNVWATRQAYCWNGDEYIECDNPEDYRYSYYLGDDYFISGQTIDPAEYGGQVEIVELGVHDDCPHCNDPYGDRFNATRAALGVFDDDIDDSAGLVEYSNAEPGGADVYQGMTTDFNEVRNSLKINPGGGTNISAGLLEANNLIQSEGNEDARDYIILLTDGKHNTGPEPDSDPVVDSVADDTTVYTVGFGDAENTTLENVANDAGTEEGQYFEAANSEELISVFESIGEDIKDDKPEYLIEDVEIVGSDTVTQGETITVEANIRNNGSGVGELPILLFDTGFNDFPVNGRLKEIDSGNTETGIQLEYDTTGAVDWSTEAGDRKTGNLTVQTPDEEDSLEVTIEEPPEPVFEVDILGTNSDSNDPVIAGEENLTMEANITNTAAVGGTQDIVLRRGDGSPTPVSTDATLESGKSTNVTLTWAVPLRDAGVDEVEVATDDNTDTEPVFITEPQGDGSSEFEVAIEPTTDDEVTAGGIVDVDVNVTNVGGIDDDVIVTLYDQFGEPADAARTSELAPGNSEPVDLSWVTDSSVPTGDAMIAVEAGESRANKTIEITSSDGNFVVENVSTNADKGVDSITENDRLEVTTNITNNGGDAEQTIDLLDQAGNIKVIETVFVPAGETKRVELDWENADSSVTEVTVDAQDDEASQKVTINSLSGPTVFNSMDVTTNASSRANSVDAGQPIKVTAEIDSPADENNVIVGAEAFQASGEANSIGWKKVNIDATGTNTIEFIWHTQPRLGDDDNPWTVRVSALGSSEVADAYIDEVDFTNPGDRGLEDDVPVGIEIDDIVIS